jgi:dihydrodipicolinate synthase/N-acetylneuraminate lyase
MLHKIKRRKSNSISHNLCTNVTEGNTEGTRKWRRRLKQLLDVLKENRGYEKFKEAALDRTL